MIILGWIGILLVLLAFFAWISQTKYETYYESFITLCGIVGFIVGFFGAAALFAWVIVKMINYSFPEAAKNQYTPTVLVCNDVRVAESVDGFVYNSKGGAYEDYRNNLTYTPRQGEVCKELLKESKQ
jgi:hypothetical protein